MASPESFTSWESPLSTYQSEVTSYLRVLPFDGQEPQQTSAKQGGILERGQTPGALILLLLCTKYRHVTARSLENILSGTMGFKLTEIQNPVYKPKFIANSPNISLF
jgi:hypothetical protein